MKFRNTSNAFTALLGSIMAEGENVTVRNNETREIRNAHVELTSPLERSVAVPFRHNDPFATIAETMWVLAGRNDIAFLRHYLPRAQQFSDDGVTWRAGYGKRLRDWHGTDQVRRVVELLQDDSTSRRAVISLFDPATDFDGGLDVPCTNWLQFTIRDGAVALAVTVRSNDLFWGFSGINTFEWSVLLEMVAHWVGARPGHIHYFIGSLHVYAHHFDRAQRVLSAATTAHATAGNRSSFATDFDEFDNTVARWFQVEELIREEDPQAAAVIEAFPDPLLRDFLRMLLTHWTEQHEGREAAKLIAEQVEDADLQVGLAAYARWKGGTESLGTSETRPRLTFDDLKPAIRHLHRAKDGIYGNSWKRRGEQIGVLANIARKIDRLEYADLTCSDDTESVVDAAVDLYVYALKYRTFLLDVISGAVPGTGMSDGPEGFDGLLDGEHDRGDTPGDPVAHTVDALTSVEDAVSNGSPVQARLVAAEALSNAARSLLLHVAAHQPAEAASFVGHWPVSDAQ